MKKVNSVIIGAAGSSYLCIYRPGKCNFEVETWKYIF